MNINKKLCISSEDTPGQVIWMPKGKLMFEKLKNILRNIYNKEGGMEIDTPLYGKQKIWKTSGHCEKYLNNIFSIDAGDENNKYFMRPMQCPIHLIVIENLYKNGMETPITVYEMNNSFRKELSGSLSGLFRLTKFTQDDSHILCKTSEISSVIKSFISQIKELYSYFPQLKNVRFKISSMKKEDYIGDFEKIKQPEDIFKSTLDECGIDYGYSDSDGAFYAVKLDVNVNDTMGRDWQVGTLQMDWCILNRFNASWISSDYVIMHRALLGSFERFMGIILDSCTNKEGELVCPLPECITPFETAYIILDKCYELCKSHKGDIFKGSVHDIQSLVKKVHEHKYINYAVIGPKDIKNGYYFLINRLTQEKTRINLCKIDE